VLLPSAPQLAVLDSWPDDPYEASYAWGRRLRTQFTVVAVTDRRGPARIPAHDAQGLPAPGTMGCAHQSGPEVPEKQDEIEGQDRSGQAEPDDDVEEHKCHRIASPDRHAFPASLQASM
jgi:hypothetical protein